MKTGNKPCISQDRKTICPGATWVKMNNKGQVEVYTFSFIPPPGPPRKIVTQMKWKISKSATMKKYDYQKV